MKKLKTTLICAVLIYSALAIPLSANADGWDYKSEETIDLMEGRWYLRTDCEKKPGDDCNMPGSATRIDISELMELVLIIQKLRFR